MNTKLPAVSGLKECQQDKNGVTMQWDPVNCEFSAMYFVVQTRADNDESTAKSFKVPSNVTNFQVPIEENWKQLTSTVHCEIDEQFQGEKCTPIVIELIGNDPEAILLHLKKRCIQGVCERVQQVFSQKETRLNLRGGGIEDGGAIAVANILPHLPQLQELNLHGNRIEDAGATAIASAINSLLQLQELNLHGNLIGDAGATAIADSISNLTQLQLFSLSYNQIGDTGATAIANFLTNLTQLQELYIDYNRIRDTGAIALVNSMVNLTQLRELHLRYNEIGDIGTMAISNSIAHLTQLDYLSLYYNPISEPEKQRLKQQFGVRISNLIY